MVSLILVLGVGLLISSILEISDEKFNSIAIYQSLYSMKG